MCFFGQAFDRAQIQVIVVVVRDYHNVNPWQIFEGQPGRTEPSGPAQEIGLARSPQFGSVRKIKTVQLH